MTFMAPFDQARYGLGLEDLAIGKKQGIVDEGYSKAGQDEDVMLSGHNNPLVGLGVPSNKRSAGRPTNARDRLP